MSRSLRAAAQPGPRSLSIGPASTRPVSGRRRKSLPPHRAHRRPRSLRQSGPIHSPDVTIWAYRLHESSTSAHHARLHQHPGACMNDDDLFRFHNGDTLNNIPVIRDEEPRSFPWRTVGAVAGVAALVGSVVGLSFGLGDRHHTSQTVAAATVNPTPATTPSTAPSPSVVTATATVQAPAQTVYAAPTEGTDSDGATAEAVVEQYYNAVNAQEYQTAWELGGRNMSPSYDTFVSGYSDTTYTQVQVT